MRSLNKEGTAVESATSPSKKNRYWWMNTEYQDEPSSLSEFPTGSYELLESFEERNAPTSSPTPIDNGAFSPFASLLFMINGHRPGPVSGFYAVVEVIKGAGWCVCQLHADAATPLRVFRTPVYESEAEARQAAEKLRLTDVGNAPPRI